MNISINRDSRAFMNWKRASNQNFPAARLRVGDHHWYGLGVERNYAQAALYYRMCSEDNDPHASAQVGNRTTPIRVCLLELKCFYSSKTLMIGSL